MNHWKARYPELWMRITCLATGLAMTGCGAGAGYYFRDVAARAAFGQSREANLERIEACARALDEAETAYKTAILEHTQRVQENAGKLAAVQGELDDLKQLLNLHTGEIQATLANSKLAAKAAVAAARHAQLPAPEAAPMASDGSR